MQNRAKAVAPYAARSLSLRLSGSVSESFGGLTSLQAAPEAAAPRGAANHAQNNMDASMSYTGNYEAGQIGQEAPPDSKHRRAPATRTRQRGTPKHQRPSNLHLLLHLRSTKVLFYLYWGQHAIRDAYRSEEGHVRRRHTGGPTAGPAALAFWPQRAFERPAPSDPEGAT